MSGMQKALAAALLALLVLVAYGIWSTQPARGQRAAPARGALDALGTVDQSLLATAQRLAPLATSAEEQSLAASALRLSDHELDVTLTAALRQLEAHPPALTAEAQQIDQRLQRSQKLLAADQDAVARLGAALGASRPQDRPTLQDQLDLAQSQVELDRDEVEEANQDLLDAGGNQHQRIQSMLQEHGAAEQKRAAPASTDALAGLHALAQRVREWRTERAKAQALEAAALEASSDTIGLSAQRRALAAQLETSKESNPALASHSKRARSSLTAAAVTAAAPPDAAALLGATRQIAADQKVLTLLDQRISDRRQLTSLYQRWQLLALAQASTVLHGALRDAAALLAVLLLLVCIDGWLDRLLLRARLDRRQAETLRSVTRVALQMIALVIALLMLIGLPGQVGTMIGIAGAGLTVALKDFIVAFIGWLVLMGRNGIRLGDWVEINGVSGEVIELNMFHTVLLETGNWTDAGHPTGRRVTFTNSYAIQGHYFNFSTSGQWLWDELVVLVPYGRDPNIVADAILKDVLAATAESSHLAEQEWRRLASGRRGASLTVSPGINVRPAVGGVEIAVRYVTRASDRLALRARLYTSAVELLAQGGERLHVPA